MLKCKYIGVKSHENGFVLITYDMYDNNNPLLCKLLILKILLGKWGDSISLNIGFLFLLNCTLYVKL